MTTPSPSRSPSPEGAPQAPDAAKTLVLFRPAGFELDRGPGGRCVLTLRAPGVQVSVWLDLDKRRELAALLALPGEVAAGLARERAELEALRAELVTLREEVTKLEARPVTTAEVTRWIFGR